MNATTCTIDGFGPLPLVRPESVQEVGELIRQAASKETALYPVGGGTSLSLGNSPTRVGQAVDMAGLAQVIDFPARDMTVTVQAGITIGVLREMLAKENLRLPIDVPQADRATLGGAVAANVSGPRRLGYGTLRDYVIGISALNDKGNEFKAGGRVVKNVAGYDLCKLLVGSLGTLGIITQVTLKLRPLAEEQAIFSVPCMSADLDVMLTKLHDSRTRPVCVDLLNRTAAQIVFPRADLPAPETPWVLIVGYEGNADAVNWQVGQLIREVGTQCPIEARVNYTTQPLWDALTECSGFTETAFKANLLPSAVAAFCQSVNEGTALRAHAGNGIVNGHWPAGLTKDQVGSMLSAWRGRAQAGQGSVIVNRCPSEWKSTLDVWGPPPESAWLMREVKAKFDPKRLFNPGRFVDGI